MKDYGQAPRSAAEADARVVREQYDDPRHALQHLARHLGHDGLVLESTPGGRYFTTCDCGFVSTTRRTQADALGAVIHHIELAVKAWHRTGLPLPKQPPRLVRPEAEMERRHRHYATNRAAERAKAGADTPVSA